MEKTFESIVDNTQFNFDGRQFKKVKEQVRAGKPYNAVCINSPSPKEDCPTGWLFEASDEVKVNA